ncbi:VCBS repeat-containing protein [Algoriphagus sediminis]|uniref:VCBS repeat-containing protein n=1 Tax=Algoriphagus sediminis TaxID=3057113 RepID=A0ABT7YFW5_9BACT|nr:VCBS repeat-containing protein [Algoriphagus sediminis]MDN3205377.1 VCBS repeat-containing protein [Algoriphagus sediminis]
MKYHLHTICFLLLTLGACAPKAEQEGNALWKPLLQNQTGIQFRNDLEYTEQVNPYTFRNFYNGAGVALGDINNDGLIDIFFTGNQVSNRLYLNKGKLIFEDITEKAGLASLGVWSTGVSMADINQDGLLDIYVCKSGPPGGPNRKNQLFINQGNNSFQDQAEEYGLDEEGLSQHAVFFDFDKDGDLDMYLLSNSGRSVGVYDLREGQREIRDPEGGNKLFRNDGETFKDISEEAGIYGSSIGYGLGVTVADLNQDSWPDLYISNDFFERDYLYINNQNGTFTESLELMLNEISLGSMGADVADLNNDGLQEIFVTEMLPATWERIKTKTPFEDWDKYQANLANGYYHQFTRNTLQQNLGFPPESDLPVFSEISRITGTDATDWSWGALIFDADNDGLKDIFVANGIVKDLTDFDFVDFYTDRQSEIEQLKEDSLLVTRMIDQFPSVPLQNYWFKNQGNWAFQNEAGTQGLNELTFSTGSAYGDLDNDGDLDLVVNNQNDFASIYQNQSMELGLGNYIKFDFGNNFGTKVTLYYDGQIQFQEYQPVKGYLSSVAQETHFGIDSVNTIDSVKILWPNGKISKLYDVKTNQVINPELAEEEDFYPDFNSTPPIFSKAKELGIKHDESDFIDFDRDRLRFRMISNEGPEAAKADINSDGFEDIFIPGPKGKPSRIFLQNSDRIFSEFIFEAESIQDSEDVVGHFFYANEDEYPDLIIGAGGIEYGNYNSNYQDRLYLNDGNGNFTRSEVKFKSTPTSFILDWDIDSDGDLDLIIGERAIPFSYGLPAGLQLWENNGKGEFTDISERYLADLNPLGLLRDGAISDLDQDGIPELIVVGEWMPLRIFSMNSESWTDRTTEFGFTNTSGLWQEIKIVDLNKDGLPDILAGNWGLNSRIRSNETNPLKMIINDFDANGSTDPIMAFESEGQHIPYVLKNTLLKQIPGLRKQLLTYDSYKVKTLEELFGDEILSKSVTLGAENLASSLWLNQGNGAFKSIQLPHEAQLSPIFSFESLSLSGYDFPLVLFGGNQSKVKPELGSQMGSFGGVLMTEDGENWKAVSMEETGLFIPGETRDMMILESSETKRLIVFRNNDDALEFEIIQ